MCKIAVYAGTFDPFTYGHFDVALRASQVFDKVYIAVARESKPSILFSATERMDMIKCYLGSEQQNIAVSSFSGLLVNYAREVGACAIIRGLRAVSDYEYESQMAMTNRELSSEIETLFMMTAKQYSYISSSIVKEVARHGGDVSAMVRSEVANSVGARLCSNSKI